MSRPIKVSDDLFLALSRDAERGPITMQQALQNRLATHEQRARSLGAEKIRLERELENRERTLLMAQQEASSDQSTLRRLREEREGLIEAIEQADEEHSQLSAELTSIEDAFESTSSTLETSKMEQEKLKFQRNALLSVLLVAGVLVVAGLLIRRFFPVPDVEDKPKTEPAQVVPALLW